MEEYMNSHLGAKDRVSKHRKKTITKALKKVFSTTDAERLIVEMEFRAPDSVTKWDFDPGVKAEIIAKLIRELKAGPLKSCKNDAEYYREGQKFLHGDEGKLWVKKWFLPRDPMPVGSNSRKRSATGKTAPAKLAIAPPSLVGTPSVGAGPSASEASPPSPLSPRSPSSTPVHRDPIIQPVSSSSGASPTKVTPSPTSVSDPPTIVCTPSVDVGGAAPPGNEVAFSEEVYGPGEGALCVRCWTIHSTKMGGPFVYMWPAGSSTLIDATEEGNRGWRQQLTAKKFVLSAVAFGGALAAGSLAWDTPLHILLSKPHWGRYPVA